jgi:hypothetical protein
MFTVISESEWKEFFQPQLVRLMKRNAEVALPVWQSVFRALRQSTTNVDVTSSFVDPFLTLLLEPLQSKEDEQRAMAVNVATELIECVEKNISSSSSSSSSSSTSSNNAATVVRSALNLVWATLITTSSTSSPPFTFTTTTTPLSSDDVKHTTTPKFLPYWYQRVGLIRVIEKLSLLVTRAADPTLCPAVVEWLVKLLRVEGTKEVQIAAFDALREYAALLSSELSSEVVTFWVNAILPHPTTTEVYEDATTISVRRHVLITFTTLLHLRPTLAVNSVVRNTPHLIKGAIDRVLQCKTKPLYIVDGMLALTLLITIATHVPEIGSLLSLLSHTQHTL